MDQAVSIERSHLHDLRTGAGTRTQSPTISLSVWFWVVLGGLPIIFPAVLLMGEGRLAATEPIYWYFWVTAAVSAPHVYATYVRLQRKIAERRVSSLWGVPAYLGCVSALAAFAWCGYFVEAMTAVNLIQTYHYLRQVYGVQRLTTRELPKSEGTELLTSLAYHLPIPLFVLGRWNMLAVVWREPSAYLIPVPVAPWILRGCMAVAFIGLLCGIAAELLRTKLLRSRYGIEAFSGIGWVQLMLYFTIHWYGFLSVENYQRGFFLITIFHAVQYLSVVWLFEKKSRSGSIPFLPALSFEQSLVLFWGLTFGAAYLFEQLFIPSVSTYWPMLAIIILSAVSAHHYIIDAVIWRKGVLP